MAAGHCGDAEVTFSGQNASLGVNGSFQVGYGQWRNDSGVAGFEMALPPVGLALSCKGTDFRTVPQLMLLDEVNTQNEWFIQIGYDVELVCESFVSDFEVELF